MLVTVYIMTLYCISPCTTCIVKAVNKKSWEMPQMYLQKGKYGPHYILYNFKCTESLITCDLKSLKVAGQLKYEVSISCQHYTSAPCTFQSSKLW